MEWQETGLEQSYCRIVGMDPSADWILGPGFADLSRGDEEVLIPFTIGPLDETTLELIRSAQNVEGEHFARATGIFIPELYREVEVGGYLVGFAKRGFFDDLAREDGPLDQLRTMPKQIHLSLPLKAKSLPESWRRGIPAKSLLDPPVYSPLPDGWPDGTVVIGIIDDGIAFAHERFRLSDGSTRVQFFWHQDGVLDSAGSTVDFGREIWKLDLPLRKGIDSLLRDHTQANLVDEERLYREAGLIDFHDGDHKSAARRLSHGTHVLDLAAGYEPHLAPTNRPIIAVQLPVAITADTTGSELTIYAEAAIKYILDRANRLAGSGPPLPVVINFSYGMISGPHDGTLHLERSMDTFIAGRQTPLRIVLPAGNANLSRCHAELGFDSPGDTVSLRWRVQSDDHTPTQMEIWLPHEASTPPAASRVTMCVESPSGLRSPPLGETVGTGVQLISNGEVVARAHYAFRPFPTERGVFYISLQPTGRLRPPESPGSTGTTAPAGVWKVLITNSELPPGKKLQAWIQWDDVIYGYSRRGRQSQFEADCYLRFDSITGDAVDMDHEDAPSIPACRVKRRGLINAIATGEGTIVIGGVHQKDLIPPKYSAGGPTTPTAGESPHRKGPDALSVSDDSRVHNGIFGAGSKSGSTVAMNGTSVAAPQIARLVVDMLAAGGSGDRAAVRLFGADEEFNHAQASPRPSDERGGSGRIIRSRPDRPPRYEPDT